MKELRLILDQQLSQLEKERESLEESIAETHRRYGVLDDVESWNLLAPEEVTRENGMNHLSESGEQKRESSEGTVPEGQPEPALHWDIEETQAFDVNGLPLRARDMFKQQTLPA